MRRRFDAATLIALSTLAALGCSQGPGAGKSDEGDDDKDSFFGADEDVTAGKTKPRSGSVGADSKNGLAGGSPNPCKRECVGDACGPEAWFAEGCDDPEPMGSGGGATGGGSSSSASSAGGAIETCGENGCGEEPCGDGFDALRELDAMATASWMRPTRTLPTCSFGRTKITIDSHLRTNSFRRASRAFSALRRSS
jgi:hypothetical protein